MFETPTEQAVIESALDISASTADETDLKENSTDALTIFRGREHIPDILTSSRINIGTGLLFALICIPSIVAVENQPAITDLLRSAHESSTGFMIYVLNTRLFTGGIALGFGGASIYSIIKGTREYIAYKVARAVANSYLSRRRIASRYPIYNERINED